MFAWLLALSLVTPSPRTHTAPGFAHDMWTSEDGLPLDHVVDVAQTPDGFLWVATVDGLVRYDGRDFELFTVRNSALPNNRLVALETDGRGRLWLRSESGDVAVRHPDGRIERIAFTRHGLPTGFHQDAAGVIWFTIDDGLGRYDDSLTAMSLFQGGESIEKLSSHGSVLWATTSAHRVVRLESGRATFLDAADGVPEADLRGVLETDRGVWLGSVVGVHTLVAGRFEPVTKAGAPWTTRVAAMRPTERGILVATDGLFELVPGAEPAKLAGSGDRRAPIAGERLGPWLLDADRVLVEDRPVWRSNEAFGLLQAALVDREGALWFATRRMGLHRLRRTAIRTLSVEDGLCGRNVVSLALARDAVWVGTAGDGYCTVSAGRIASGTVRAGVIRSIAEVDGAIWLGSKDSIAPTTPGSAVISGAFGWVSALLPEATGMWIGTDTGLFWRPTDGALIRRGPSAATRFLLRARSGRLWVSTADGLYVSRASDVEFERVAGFPSRSPRGLWEDPDGAIWAGTEDQGLVRVRATVTGWQVARPIGRAQGLPHDGVHTVLADARGDIWGSTNRGLFRAPLQQLQALADGADPDRLIDARPIRHFDHRDGMRNREGNGLSGHSAVRHADGTLWFATQDGVAIVDPDAVVPMPAAPLVITGVSVDGVARAVGTSLTVDRAARLQLRFASLHLESPERVSYRYRLLPLDQSWVPLGQRRELQFSHLPPGRYRLVLQAAHADSSWSDSQAALVIEVRPAWYQTFWALAGLVFAVLSIIAALVWWRLAVSRQRQRTLQTMVELRTSELRAERQAAEESRELIADQARELAVLDEARSRFFANISHEFRTPLTLLLGPLEDLRAGRWGQPSAKQAQQLELAQRSALGLLSLVEQLLDVARIDADRVELRRQATDLTPFVAALYTRFQPLAERCGLDFTYRHPDEILVAEVDVGELDKVLGNLLANACKFTPDGGRIELALTGDRERVHILVQDTGPGLSREQQARVFDRFQRTDGDAPGTGLGLAVARELVALHDGVLALESEVGAGARFTVSLPRIDAARLRERTRNAAELRERASDAAPGGLLETHAHADGAVTGDQRPVVLVIDDDARIRAFVTDVLEPEWRVVAAANGRSGIARARAEVPDVVLCDVMMPDLDGPAVCRALGDDPETDFIPLVLLTARVDRDSRLTGLQAGAEDYLQKPFEPEELRIRLRNLVHSRQKLRAHIESRPVDESAPRSADEVYLEQVESEILAHLDDGAFNVAALAERMGQDRSSLYRRVLALTGSKPSTWIRTMRLQQASRMLRARSATISEIAYGVGFNSLSSFSRAFKQRYGMSPSVWQARSDEPRDESDDPSPT